MKKLLTGILLLFLFFLLICFPEDVKRGALDGLSLWYHSVLPILLPFLILSNLMIATGCLSGFFQPFRFLRTRYPNVPFTLCYPIFFGLFCGFPMGAKLISDMVRSKKITAQQGNLFLPFVNQASPMFLAGYVGVHILKKTLSFLEILSYLFLPSLVILLLRILFSSVLSTFSRHYPEQNTAKKTRPEQIDSKDKNSMSLNMEHTIWNAFHIIVTIGIYMMLFTAVTELCRKLLPNNRLFSLLLCSLEFSSGLDRLAGLTYIDPVIQTGLVLALTSFGGFCTAAQTSSLIKETDISMKSYLLWKILTAILVFLFYASSSSS